MFFSNYQNQLNQHSFSKDPFTFLQPDVHNDLASIIEIALIENGDRLAREAWQSAQLQNVLQNAHSGSLFWRNRIPKILPKDDLLKNLPILTRKDVTHQVNAEGSLFQSRDSSKIQSYASSGSTGIPVKVHACLQNARYNELRSMAQYFIEGRKLNHNRTFIKPANGYSYTSPQKNFKVEKYDGWLGGLNKIYVSGSYKIIHYDGDEKALIDEIGQNEIGYLACLSSHMDILLKYFEPSALKNLGMHMWLHHSDNLDDVQRNILNNEGITTRSGYSCSEVGPIAVECLVNQGFYHVAHSNVIVEVDYEEGAFINNEKLGRILITHLHSYATPLVRYEVGDFGQIHSTCPCGHDGTTLSHIYGRKKYFLRTCDGDLIPFPIFSKPLLDITSFTEFFVYQPDLSSIVVELGGRDFLDADEMRAIKKFISNLSQDKFNVSVITRLHIDWSKNPKRLPFISYVS